MVQTASPRPVQVRWLGHLGLIAGLAVSLYFEPVLTIHVVAGLVFVGLVAAHLWQRRRTSMALLGRLRRFRGLHRPAGRLAIADALLLATTVIMLVSGCWDLAVGHPTRIRWHAISGVLLVGAAIVHTVRRRRRMRSSRVR